MVRRQIAAKLTPPAKGRTWLGGLCSQAGENPKAALLPYWVAKGSVLQGALGSCVGTVTMGSAW